MLCTADSVLTVAAFSSTQYLLQASMQLPRDRRSQAGSWSSSGSSSSAAHRRRSSAGVRSVYSDDSVGPYDAQYDSADTVHSSSDRQPFSDRAPSHASGSGNSRAHQLSQQASVQNSAESANSADYKLLSNDSRTSSRTGSGVTINSYMQSGAICRPSTLSNITSKLRDRLSACNRSRATPSEEQGYVKRQRPSNSSFEACVPSRRYGTPPGSEGNRQFLFSDLQRSERRKLARGEDKGMSPVSGWIQSTATMPDDAMSERWSRESNAPLLERRPSENGRRSKAATPG